MRSEQTRREGAHAQRPTGFDADVSRPQSTLFGSSRREQGRRSTGAPWRPPKRLHNYPACVEIMAAGETAGLRIDRPHSTPNEFLFLEREQRLFSSSTSGHRSLHAGVFLRRRGHRGHIDIYIETEREREIAIQICRRPQRKVLSGTWAISKGVRPAMTGLFAPPAPHSAGGAPGALVPQTSTLTSRER